MKRPDGQTLFLGLALVLAVAVVGIAVLAVPRPKTLPAESATSKVTLEQIPVDGQRAYRYLKTLCDLGPRFSGSAGMQAQQKWLHDHFRQLGGEVTFQSFAVRHPLDGSRVEMANLIVQWHPDRKDRVLLCAHYDTRPFPDQDPDPTQRRGTFVGANDGASGVAVLAELAHWMKDVSPIVGVDFVLFDGEELVYDSDKDPYFLGSRYFAEQYVRQPPAFRYRAAVLLDMVGDANLQLYQERYSMRWSDSRPIVEEIWRTARGLGVTEFIPRRRHEIRDDHLMLHEIGKIPAIDIIDFDYGPPGRNESYWHTRQDTPDKCSALSLAKVGWVVLEWLRQQR